MENEISFGEKRVRTSFNPSDDSVVQNIKERAAEMINYIADNVGGKDEEQIRLKSKAFDAIEEASMWGVKAATY